MAAGRSGCDRLEWRAAAPGRSRANDTRIRHDTRPSRPIAAAARTAAPRRDWQQLWRDAVRDPRELLDAARPGRAGRAPVGCRRGAVPAAGAARLRRAHAPRRSGRSAAAPGAAAGRRRPARCRASAWTRSATAPRAGRARRDAQVPRAAPCWSPPAVARCTAATASAATSPTPRKPRRPTAGAGRSTASRADPSIDEVILSGGDPLSLATRQAGRTDRRPGRGPAPAAPAPAHPPAGGAARTRRRRAARTGCARLPWPVTVVAARQPRATNSTPRSTRPWPACARPARRCSTRRCCCAGSTTTSTPWPR